MPSCSRLSRQPSPRATSSTPCALGGAPPRAVASVCPLLLLLLLLQLCGAWGGLLHSAQRKLSACTPHDDSDLGVATCEDWCSEPAHCSFCKCRHCSLCQRACDPSSEGDVHFEGCESWCEDQAHCGMCKCKGCEICKGHHPERACKPASSSDLPFESCQVWCQGGQHCQYCKCKGCASCANTTAARQACQPKDSSDLAYAACESWCGTGTFNCHFCKCKNCGACPRCLPWCSTLADCNSKACRTCSICGGGSSQLLCEDWCRSKHCDERQPNHEMCSGCRICGTPQRPPPPPSPPKLHAPLPPPIARQYNPPQPRPHHPRPPRPSKLTHPHTDGDLPLEQQQEHSQDNMPPFAEPPAHTDEAVSHESADTTPAVQNPADFVSFYDPHPIETLSVPPADSSADSYESIGSIEPAVHETSELPMSQQLDLLTLVVLHVQALPGGPAFLIGIALFLGLCALAFRRLSVHHDYGSLSGHLADDEDYDEPLEEATSFGRHNTELSAMARVREADRSAPPKGKLLLPVRPRGSRRALRADEINFLSGAHGFR